MSNLVTPMLTSVDKSPVDFYSTNICFPNPSRNIISSSKEHQRCVSETPFRNEYEKLVNRNIKYYANSTCNKDKFNSTRKSVPTSTLFSNEPGKSFESKVCSPNNDDLNTSENLHLVAFSDSPDSSNYNEQPWNKTNSENNSCAKACVNVNMGYNEGSSLESVISNVKNKEKLNFSLLEFQVTEPSSMKPTETKSLLPKPDSNSIQLNPTSSPQYSRNINQVKTFKNNSKTGHSRMWGSCGSAGTLQLNFDFKNLITDQSASLETSVKPRSHNSVSGDAILIPEAEIRNRPLAGNNNKLKRISQVSFEAEFDSEGRTHEQISIDIRKWDPYLIAGEITFIELSYFKAVKAEEFMSFKWTGLSKHTHAPAIVASTRWFNQLNFWAQRIILECSDLIRRSEMLSYLIRILKKLVDYYNNLSSGMAIMSALQVECIHRLKNTWNNISNKDKANFRRMEDLFSSENNYEKLRIHIDSLKLPCIPYLGLYLTDLTYINVAHSKLSEFESQTKTDQINNILRTVSEFQQSEYDIVHNQTLYRYLDNQRYIEELQKIIEENNYRTSIFLEPNVTDPSAASSRQQPDHPVINSTSPQKTPPSYACKHSAKSGYLQCPISPKPMSSILLNESIKEVSEQLPNINTIQDNPVTVVDDVVQSNSADERETCHVISNEPSITSSSHPEVPKGPMFEKIITLGDYMQEDDSVRASLLCGAGIRKSTFKKKAGNKTIRFKRDSSSSSRQQVSSKTATLSSSSHATSIDKDSAALPSMSLLDDSYLDATLTDTCTIPVIGTDVPGQQLARPDISTVGLPAKQKELLCSPPICRCKIKGGSVDLKPKASSNRKTEMRNLVKIAHAAESAVQYSKKNTSFYSEPPLDSENGNDTSFDDSQTCDSRESLKLICQGVLSRKTCLKNSKKSRFSMWSRYWVVLIVSGSNSYIVYFENSHYRASERKDFKHKKCHVQDLRSVSISLNKPSSTCNITETDRNLSESPVDSSNDKQSELRRFFIIDKEYGTVYKFRNSVSKRRKSIDKIDTENEQCLQSSSSCQQILSLSLWYRLLIQCINKMNKPIDDNKDLIVLNDS